MSRTTDYERETLNAYRTATRASTYKRLQTTDWTWARFVTWREQRILARELSRYEWSSGDRLLDIPCGTGILGNLLHRFPFRIVASDISPEMMALARSEYPVDRLDDCVQADITRTPFPRGSFACVVTLGFLHRVPAEIKHASLAEIAALTTRLALVSCSIDTRFQRIKHAVLGWLRRTHVPAPCPARLAEIVAECESHGFRVVRTVMVVPLFSAHTIFVLEKTTERDGATATAIPTSRKRK